MKIVCDNCATKYSIADEKVRGKVFKIRCKKCSHIIVVKGNEGGAAEVGAPAEAAAEPAQPDVAAAAAADGWHVVINGEQVGPLQPAEIRAKFRAGEIDAETYAWREGFGDWQRLAAIDEFHDLQPAAPPSDATKRTGPEDLFGADPAPSAGADLFGAPAGDLFSGGAAAPAPSGGGQGQGLFAQPAAEPAPMPRRSPTPGFGAQAAGGGHGSDGPGAGTVDAKMTGQRNESSVLFSLNNLQALASGGGGAKAPAAGGGGAVDNRPGFANSQTEGSGLIDIRAMAAATLSSSPSPGENRGNELPSFSSAAVFSPIAAPILMPSAPSGPPRWIWPVIALGVAALASIIVIGVLILNKKPDQVAVAPTAVPGGTVPVGTAPPVPGAPAAAGIPGTTAATPTPPAPGTTAPAAEAKADRGARDSGHEASGRERGGKSKGGGKTAVAAATPAPRSATPAAAEPAPAATPKRGKKGGDEIDDLLNNATERPKPAAREERAAAPAASNEDLPDSLDKGAIVAGMKKVSAKVQACYEQFKVPGLAMVAVTVAHTGKVSNASVSGAFAGTPTGDCVAKAVRSASFSAFKSPTQNFNYPYAIR